MIGSITSGLVNNIKDIGLAKILNLTPFVGMIGNVVFMSSGISVRTFENLTRKTTAKFAEHEVIGGKPVSEFVGVELDSFNFDIVLYSGLGVEPLTEFENLKSICESGIPQRVFLHGKTVGKFTIRDVEGEEKYWVDGRPAVMGITLALKEFVETTPTQAEMKLREDELRREDTGIGGPEKLAGTAENKPTQPRTLTPKIDPVTRMVVK